MKMGIGQMAVEIDTGALIRLRRAKGVEVRCLAGGLWITQENEPGDEMLEAGGVFRLTSNQLVIIEALSPPQLAFRSFAGKERCLDFAIFRIDTSACLERLEQLR